MHRLLFHLPVHFRGTNRHARAFFLVPGSLLPGRTLTPGASRSMYRRGRALVQGLQNKVVILCGVWSSFGREVRSDGSRSRQKCPARGARTRVATHRDGQSDADEGEKRLQATWKTRASSLGKEKGSSTVGKGSFGRAGVLGGVLPCVLRSC